MQEKTKQAYLKLAHNFYEQRLNGQQPTANRVIAALRNCAAEYRPAYWRKLRNALAYAQDKAGYKQNSKLVNATSNPVTSDDSDVKPKSRLKRAKKVSEADHAKLLSVIDKNEDISARAAIMLCKHLGCRPAELENIHVKEDVIYIESAKKSDDMKRGLDRKVSIDPSLSKLLNHSSLVIKKEIMKGRSIKQIQDRVFLYAKEAFPRRSARISLYSYRHQLGSNLKSDKSISSKQVAYIMGHQATASIEQYGHVKSGTGNAGIEPAVEIAEIEQLVRDTIKPMSESMKSERAETNEDKTEYSSATFKM